MQVLHFQHHIACRLLRLIHLEGHLAAHHHAGKLVLGHGFHIHGVNVLTKADDGTVVGGGLDFFQLVRDQDDALAVGGQVMHDVNELHDLLGGERCGRLVQDQHISAPVQRLENFHTLLHTHGNILDLRVRIDGKAIALGNLHHVFPGGSHIQHDTLPGLRAQDNVFRHRKGLDQHEVLVHHADARRDSVTGCTHIQLLSINDDVAGGGLVQAVKLVHQRGFSRAVFTQDRVDLTLMDRQIDTVIGGKVAEFFHDIAHFDNLDAVIYMLFCQAYHPSC